jgi:16S rRNA (guanine966-N2)-methyltransferase
MHKHKLGQIRIIGGKWRSRKINFPPIPDLRPTPNRIRETIFNWLSPAIIGAKCLDLFAGSGALSFEALSRGALFCLAFDADRRIVEKLNENAQQLQAKNIEIILGKFPYPKTLRRENFDIVFIDPPFHAGYVAKCCQWLKESECLAPDALIYIEAEPELDLMPLLPANWTIIRSKTAGQVGYHLIQIMSSIT